MYHTNTKLGLKEYVLSKEMQLLLLSTVADLSFEQEQHLRELTLSTINWQEFIKLAIKNRVYTLVYKNLNRLENFNIDQNVLAILERRCKKNQLDSLRQTTELVKIMGILEEQGIQAISIKGPLLGLSLYGNIAMRTSHDLDILVNIDDIKTVEDILLQQGYHTVNLSPRQKNYYIRKYHHLSYQKGGSTVELHWRFHEEKCYNISFKEAWDNKTGFIISGLKINVLNNSENFLYLVLHGSKHAWKRLRWLCDIREIINSNELDWDQIWVRANQKGISHMLEQSLALLDRLFQIKTPLQFNQKNIDDKATRLAVMCLPFINNCDELDEMFGHPLFLHKKRYMMIWHTSLQGRIRYIALSYFPNVQEFEAVTFQDKYFFMYYLVCPFFKLQRVLKARL